MNYIQLLRQKLSRFALFVSLITLALGSFPSPGDASSKTSNGHIASYGGDSINIIDRADGSFQEFTHNPDYSTSFFDVTADGQNFMTMFQSYDGTYVNSPLKIYTPQTGQFVEFRFDETYYNTMSPDGSKISFYEIDDNYMSIYDMSTDSISKMKVPSYLSPVWSPDSTKVAYLKYDFKNPASGVHGAYTDLKTGANYTVPTLGKPLDWSPDGKKIAFMSTYGQYAISIYDVDTKSVTFFNPGNKLDMNHQAINFIWSPDMHEVAFTICESANNTCTINVGSATGSTFDTYPAAKGYGSKIKWVPEAVSNSVYRFWSPKNQHHFYTSNYIEAMVVMLDYTNDIWTYEGIAYKASPAGSCASGESAVYRFWSDKNSSHFFTINEAEKQHVINSYPTNIWRYESEAFCASTSAKVGYKPVYRFWSDKLSGHFFTTNEAEKNFIIANYPTNVWRYEGNAYYVQ